ncbi:MAG: PepSY domain-containing protein, partial [Lentisphaeraceae bacterium]|nr:PepSY domain-containing protein [Lentisphaeraceae bacterium]
GRFGGWITKTLWTLAGLAISLSILIGSIIWWMRVSRKDESGRHRSPASSYIPLVCNIALMLFVIYSSYLFIYRQLSASSGTKPSFKLSEQKIGPWEVAAFVHKETADVKGSYYSFEFPESIPNIKSMYAWSGDPQKPDSAKPLRGSMIRYEVPGKGVQESLNVQIEDHNGGVYKASFPLSVDLNKAELSKSVPTPPLIPFGVKFMVVLFIMIASVPMIFWLIYIR